MFPTKVTAYQVWTLAACEWWGSFPAVLSQSYSSCMPLMSQSRRSGEGVWIIPFLFTILGMHVCSRTSVPPIRCDVSSILYQFYLFTGFYRGLFNRFCAYVSSRYLFQTEGSVIYSWEQHVGIWRKSIRGKSSKIVINVHLRKVLSSVAEPG